MEEEPLYFPYLYGRRAERNALIDVVNDLGPLQKVHPIIEPYSAADDLTKLLDTYRSAGTKLHMVINPTRGALQTGSERAAWTAAVAGYVAQPALITPVLHVFGYTSGTDIASFLAAYPSRDVALVVLQGGLSPMSVAAAVGSRKVRVFVGPQAAVADYATVMPTSEIIPLVVRFPVMVNASYPTETAFSLDPKSYGSAGFSDFSLIDPKPPRLGGGGAGAGAVTLHMTYQDATTKELKIQHFLSTDQVQGTPPNSLKLFQAIEKMRRQQASTPGRFLPTVGYRTLEGYFTSGHRTNLEKSKQQQISHHLATVANTL